MVAVGPVPAPREIFFKVDAFPFCSAKEVRMLSGSVPGNMNSNGKILLESPNEVFKLKVGGWQNYSPNSFDTNSIIPLTSEFGWMHFRIQSLLRESSLQA